MIKIAVPGVGGRMGGRLAALVLEAGDMDLSGAAESEGHPIVGEDPAVGLAARRSGIRVVTGLAEAYEGADAIIDFTTPACTLEGLRICADRGIAAVVGTTGFSPEEKEEALSLMNKVPSIFAANYSLGINVLLKVVKDVARALGEEYDIEIVEMHHRYKMDAPSGTALRLGEAAAEASGRELEKDGVFARHGVIGERTKREIGMQTLRGGDVVGDHSVIFAGPGERVELTHKASSRDTFARGALRAARWLVGKPAGLRDMAEVLGL